MVTTIRALRLHGAGDIRLENISTQNCASDEIRIQVAFCGICGSDLHEFSKPTLCPGPGEKHPLSGCSLPVVLGHEVSGTVSAVGSSVTDFKTGDRVTVNPYFVERHANKPPCEECKSGHPNTCPRLANYGLGAPSGGFSDEIVVKSYNAYKIPDSVSLKDAALVEPLAVAWHSARTAQFQRGQDVLILGAGPIGLAILQVLQVLGARNVIVSDILDFRKNAAEKLGATAVVDPLTDKGGVVEKVRALCGSGVDIAFDASGLQATLDTAIASVKPRGTIFNVAIHEKPLFVNPTTLSLGEKIFRGGNGYTDEDFQSVLEAMGQGQLDVKSMITSVVPLEQAIDKGFQELLTRRGDHIKILVQP